MEQQIISGCFQNNSGLLLSTHEMFGLGYIACNAEVTSVFGEILKIDSTNKVLKKLSGDANNSATWVTNMGNEYGAILQCVVTSSESNEGLGVMAEGIRKRYSDANVQPPFVLYTDNKCCSIDGYLKYCELFHQ